MENKDQVVELVSEPKIESRFGVGPENKILSNKTIKFSSAIAGISLIALFLLRSPEKEY